MPDPKPMGSKEFLAHLISGMERVSDALSMAGISHSDPQAITEMICLGLHYAHHSEMPRAALDQLIEIAFSDNICGLHRSKPVEPEPDQDQDVSLLDILKAALGAQGFKNVTLISMDPEPEPETIDSDETDTDKKGVVH
jgi:hypothetical protein